MSPATSCPECTASTECRGCLRCDKHCKSLRGDIAKLELEPPPKVKPKLPPRETTTFTRASPPSPSAAPVARVAATEARLSWWRRLLGAFGR